MPLFLFQRVHSLVMTTAEFYYYALGTRDAYGKNFFFFVSYPGTLEAMKLLGLPDQKKEEREEACFTKGSKINLCIVGALKLKTIR